MTDCDRLDGTESDESPCSGVTGPGNSTQRHTEAHSPIVTAASIGQRLYPIPDRCPQMNSHVYPGPIAAQIASIAKGRTPQAGQPPIATERNPK